MFWDFLNQQGRVVAGGQVTTGPVVDWVFAMGLPISDAYWTRARIGPAEQDVLVQLFERRVLTYTPANPEGYNVEMGNVGQHYFQWRYPHLGQPWAAPAATPWLMYASDIDTGNHWEIYLYRENGSERLTFANAESVPFSYRRSFDPMRVHLLLDSRRGNGEHRQIYDLPLQPFMLKVRPPDAELYRRTYSDGTPPPNNGPWPGYLPNGTANEYNAAYSPDGTKIAFISDRTGSPNLFIAPASGNDPGQLTSVEGCAVQVPTWSPDGRVLYWEDNCDGDFEIYRGELAYQEDSTYFVRATLVNIQKLTDNTADDRFPRVSPNGQTLAFASNREGNYEIYTINSSNGGGERRLTVSAGDDDAATWSADGQTLAFASNRDGDYEIYTMNLDGNDVRQLTNNTAQDRWPLWAQ